MFMFPIKIAHKVLNNANVLTHPYPRPIVSLFIPNSEKKPSQENTAAVSFVEANIVWEKWELPLNEYVIVLLA